MTDLNVKVTLSSDDHDCTDEGESLEQVLFILQIKCTLYKMVIDLISRSFCQFFSVCRHGKAVLRNLDEPQLVFKCFHNVALGFFKPEIKKLRLAFLSAELQILRLCL